MSQFQPGATGPPPPEHYFPPRVPLPPVGDPGWADAITRMLRAWYANSLPGATPEERIVLPMSTREYIERLLWQEAAAHPEQFAPIYEAVSLEFGRAPQGTTDQLVQDATGYLVELGNALTDALTGAASTRIRNIVNDITETSRERTERDATVTTEVTGEESEITTRRETEFFERETPEEFLDDFLTGLATWMDSLLKVGATDKGTFDFVMSNPQRFLTPYIAELGRRADEGESPYRVVGLEGAAERLGERFGGEVTTDTQRVASEQRVTDTELNEMIESTIERLTASMADDVPQDVKDTVRETVERIFKEHRETSTREVFRGVSSTITTLDIFGVPRLAEVRTPSPLDYMRETFPPITLANIAAGEAGPPPAGVGGPRAVLPSAPRRLGG